MYTVLKRVWKLFSYWKQQWINCN